MVAASFLGFVLPLQFFFFLNSILSFGFGLFLPVVVVEVVISRSTSSSSS
jgi:hypothetical protein